MIYKTLRKFRGVFFMDFTEKFINRILKLSQKSNHNRKRKFPNEELNWFRARPPLNSINF